MSLTLAHDNNVDIDFDIFEKLFNVGIKSFGYENVIEFLAKKKTKDINWICIDINDNPLDFPTSANQYINKPLMKIDYNSCDQLINDNPDIVENCILFLNWCLPNDSYYDFEAIIKLKPIAVLSIYENFDGMSGAAGGEMFYNWIQNNTDYHLKEDNKLYADMYHIDDDEIMDIRISWWQSIKLNNIDDLINKGFPCLHQGNHKSQCCIS